MIAEIRKQTIDPALLAEIKDEAAWEKAKTRFAKEGWEEGREEGREEGQKKERDISSTTSNHHSSQTNGHGNDGDCHIGGIKRNGSTRDNKSDIIRKRLRYIEHGHNLNFCHFERNEKYN